MGLSSIYLPKENINTWFRDHDTSQKLQMTTGNMECCLIFSSPCTFLFLYTIVRCTHTLSTQFIRLSSCEVSAADLQISHHTTPLKCPNVTPQKQQRTDLFASPSFLLLRLPLRHLARTKRCYTWKVKAIINWRNDIELNKAFWPVLHCCGMNWCGHSLHERTVSSRTFLTFNRKCLQNLSLFLGAVQCWKPGTYVVT